MIKMTDRVLKTGNKRAQTAFFLMALLKLGVIAGSFYLVSRVSETAVIIFILGLSIIIVTIVIEGVYQLYIHRRRGVANG